MQNQRPIRAPAAPGSARLSRRGRRRHLRRTGGFTLIELLVVISIIGLLIAILLPVLGSARVRGQQVLSANNMRQIGMAIHMYQDEFEGWFPSTTHGALDISVSWLYALADYLSDAKRVNHPTMVGQRIWEIGPVRICPRDPKASERLAAIGTSTSSSYTLNEWVSVPARTPMGTIDLSQTFNNRELLPKPSDTYVLFVLASSSPVSIFEDHTHARSWSVWGAVTGDISTDRYGANGSPQFLNGSSNYLFADNHVEEIQANVMKTEIDQGRNFARPPS